MRVDRACRVTFPVTMNSEDYILLTERASPDTVEALIALVLKGYLNQIRGGE